MRNILWAVLSVVVLAGAARAEIGRAQLDQVVMKERAATTAVTLGTTFSQADTPKLDWSFSVEVQNLSGEQICCRLDTQTVTGTSAACQRIDTASSATVARPNDWKVWKRWATNLSLFCRTLKAAPGSTADIIVTQGR